MPHRRYRRADPRRYAKLAGVRLGRRGNSLVLMGFLYFVQGLSVLGAGGFNLGFDHITGAMWIATAFVAFFNAPRPQGKDVWGFYALILMGLWLVAASIGVFVAWLSPGGYPGSPFGLVAAIAYAGVFVAWPINLIGWRENVNLQTGKFE